MATKVIRRLPDYKGGKRKDTRNVKLLKRLNSQKGKNPVPALQCNPPLRITFVTLLTLPSFLCIGPIATSQAATRDLDRSRQCVVVLTNDWPSTTGLLHACERGETTASWKKQGPEFAVVVGKNGLGQGRGLIRLDLNGAPDKKEGDDRAPAGI